AATTEWPRRSRYPMAQSEIDNLRLSLRDVAAVLEVVILNRGQVSNRERDLCARLSQAVRRLSPRRPRQRRHTTEVLMLKGYSPKFWEVADQADDVRASEEEAAEESP